MKHFRLLLPLLVLALFLSGCAGEPQPYEYTSGEYTVTVDPINQTITGNGQVYTYTVERTQVADWYEITFSDVGGVKTTGYMKSEFLQNK